MTPFKFCIEHGLARSRHGDGGELVNMMAETAPPGAKDTVVLYGAPGTELFVDTGEGFKITAMIGAFGGVVCITDNSVFLVKADKSITRIGSGLPGKVVVASNGITCLAVNGTAGIAITATTIDVIPDPDFLTADTVVFVDGYFILNESGTGRYFISGAYSTAFAALDFKTAESLPDDLVGIAAANSQLWLVGANSTEVHSNSGNALFPFDRVQGVAISHGTRSPRSLVTIGASVFWLSETGIVFQTSGYAELKISTSAIDNEIADLSADWADAFGMTYVEEGHQFYLLTIGRKTFCFDLSTRLWHLRSNITEGRHIALCMAHLSGMVLVGTSDGRILRQSMNLYTDAGQPLIAVIGSFPFTMNRKPFTVATLEIDSTVGVGPADVLLYYSDDDARTWSFPLPASIGALGAYRTTCAWWALGNSFDKRFRIHFSGNHQRSMLSTAYVEVT